MSDVLTNVGPNLRIQLLGVLFPGALILCEVWASFSWFTGRNHGEDNPIRVLSAQTSGVAVVVILVAGVTLVFLSYFVGSVAGKLAWLSWALLNRSRFLGSNLSDIMEDLNDAYPPEALASVLRVHPILAHTLDVDLSQKLSSDVATFGAPHGDALSYCKLWLRTHRPQIGVDHFEPEINLLLGLLVPLVLAPIVALALGGGEALVGALIVAVLFMALLLWLVSLRQRDELFQAIKHVFFAEWWSARDASL